MKKILITALAALFMFSGCNLEGEEPLEEGVMTPEEFFAEIKVSDATDLIDGWWEQAPGTYKKDENGNYKDGDFYGPSEFVFYNFKDGKIVAVKKCSIFYGDWEDIAIDGPVDILINAKNRTLTFNDPSLYVTDKAIAQCENDRITTIELDSERSKADGTFLYFGYTYKHVDELPTEWKPSNDDEYWRQYTE